MDLKEKKKIHAWAVSVSDQFEADAILAADVLTDPKIQDQGENLASNLASRIEVCEDPLIRVMAKYGFCKACEKVLGRIVENEETRSKS